MLQGAGAGQGATASAIVADLVQIARGAHGHPFGKPAQQLEKVQWHGNDNEIAPLYMHCHVKDNPGVLSQITACLSANDLSIAQIIQRPPQDGQSHIALITEPSMLQNGQKAMNQLTQMDFMVHAPLMMRVETL